MNDLPIPKIRPAHYQCRRAAVDGWTIEIYVEYEQQGWSVIYESVYNNNNKYRIVPDANGWLPWYPTADAVSPFDGTNPPVDLIYGTQQPHKSLFGKIDWTVPSLTHYRPAKDRRAKERRKVNMISDPYYYALEKP